MRALLSQPAAEDPKNAYADPMTDWRALYEWREEEYEAKLKASGERLKQMTHAASTARDVKSIQVCAGFLKEGLALHSPQGPDWAISLRSVDLVKFGRVLIMLLK